ncbi:ornithine decarboxylase [Rhipicephalus sanguineus]|uniref:ornithine decarboxylase n=1 Tax=Rhipicephalus sanguineus TaxID=34632 RepID=UPI0018962937|nr:ornithine decarboxylase [Rhipicephalus sanguineus]
MLMSRVLLRPPKVKAGSWTAANAHRPGHMQRPLMSQSASQGHYETDDGTYVFTRGSVHDVAKQILAKRRAEQEAFFVCDVRDIAKKVDLWRQCLPRIMPFYAIKACRDPIVLNVLNSHGVSFDCSNKGEISAVLNMGVDPDRIVYANTIKSVSDLKFAQQNGVTFMTFDSAEELVKIKDKRARLLLRIEADETGSQHSFNSKFGCSFDEAKRILQEARRSGSNVVGLSFHVGCAYQDPVIFARTIERAKAIFDMASSMGNTMRVLDVGGGFPGGLRIREKFFEVCEAIRLATDLHFPVSSGVQIIAEPGQFFVTSAYALVVQVIGKRHREVVLDGWSQTQQDVFINESRDNCVSRNLYDYLDVKIWPLKEPLERQRDVPTTVWGGTCNPVDCIERKPLFTVNVGEWLLMDNIGAYSLSRASGFNGLPYPAVHYIAPQENVSALLRILNASPLRSGFGQPEGVLKRSLLTQWRSEAAGCDEQANAVPVAALPC